MSVAVENTMNMSSLLKKPNTKTREKYRKQESQFVNNLFSKIIIRVRTWGAVSGGDNRRLGKAELVKTFLIMYIL